MRNFAVEVFIGIEAILEAEKMGLDLLLGVNFLLLVKKVCDFWSDLVL